MIGGSEDKVETNKLRSPRTYNSLTVEMGRDFKESLRKLKGNHMIIPIFKRFVSQGKDEEPFSAGGNSNWLMSLHEHSVHAYVDAMIQVYSSFLLCSTKKSHSRQLWF